MSKPQYRRYTIRSLQTCKDGALNFTLGKNCQWYIKTYDANHDSLWQARKFFKEAMD